MRAVKRNELFATFIYDGKDCADMGVYNITNGATYVMNIEPTFSDQKLEVPAYDGKYYYGTQITGQQFQFTCFCHDLSSTEYNKLRNWLNPRKVGRLILSDQPYKYYLVKPVSVSTLAAIPLTSIQTPTNSIMGDYIDGDVVYTGNFNVTFETVGSAYGYGMCYYRDDLIYDAKAKYGRDYYYNAGLLYKDMSPKAIWDIESNVLKQKIPMYNPGSAFGQPNYTIRNDGTTSANTYIQITNENAGTSTVIDVGGITGDIFIDMTSQVLSDSEGNTYYGRFTGSRMEINPSEDVIELPETIVKNVEEILHEYDSFYIENNVVSINPMALVVDESLIGRYFCVNFNGGSQIKSVDVENNTLTLDPEVETYDLPAGEIDHGVIVTPGGMAFNYVEVNNVMPVSGNKGDVCVVDGQWYVYMYGEWKVSNLFSSKDDFKNIYGDYITVYRMFGATIVTLDNITITTGTNIKYKELDGTIRTSASMPAFTLEAELQPRYL